MGRSCAPARAGVDKDIIADVDARYCRGCDHERRRDCGGRAGNHIRHVDAVVIDLMSRTSGDANTSGGEGCAVEAPRGGVERDVPYEVVAYNMIGSTRQIDTVGHPKIRCIVFRAIPQLARRCAVTDFARDSTDPGKEYRRIAV